MTDNKNTNDSIHCGNKDLIDTCYCLNNYLNENFLYNSTIDSRRLTLNELKKRGGDCLSWNVDFYSYELHSLGFKTKEISLNISNSKKHIFTIAYDKMGYCLLDQKTIKCVEYIDNNGIPITIIHTNNSTLRNKLPRIK